MKCLIPILDMCNHSNTPNCYWKKDETTGAIHLLLNTSALSLAKDSNKNSCDENSRNNNNTFLELTINYGMYLHIHAYKESVSAVREEL